MKLLAISGGPDSMHLLNDYKKANIVVAHVNYNLRSCSKKDEEIVKNFCKKNNIEFEVLKVKDKPKKNLENWAREIRYNFFAKIYQKHNCSKLLTAHHKDDFLETALMQQRTNRFPSFFGIMKKIKIKNMNVYRPYIDLYWKEEILKNVKKHNIPFALDPTNANLTFFRNSIRNELSKQSTKEKNNQLSWFKMANKILVKKTKKVNAFYKRWKNQNFDLSLFNDLKKFKQELVFNFVHQNFNNVKLSADKINSIINFLNAKDQTKKFVLNDVCSLLKNNNCLVAQENNHKRSFNL